MCPAPLAPLIDAVSADPRVRRVGELAAAAQAAPEVSLLAPPGVRPLLLAVIERARDTLQLVITATSREAEDLVAALAGVLPAEQLAVFPSWETLPHERLSPRSDTVGRRLAVLRRLLHPAVDDPRFGPLRVVVAPVRAVLQPVVAGMGELEPIRLRAGDTRPLGDVVLALVDAAYTRTDLVERRGEFAVRGGILDVFPPTEEHPLRLEFWGDQVEEVRWFKVADQRSLQVADHGLWAPPCRELLLTPQVRSRAQALIEQLPAAADLLGRLAEGIAVEGMESFAPALVDGMHSLLDELPPKAAVIAIDPERIRLRAHDLVATSEEFLQAGWANAASGNAVPIDLATVLARSSYATLAQTREHALATERTWWTISSFGGADQLDRTDQRHHDGADLEDLPGDVLRIDAREVDPYRGDSARAAADLRRWAGDERHAAVVLTDGAGLGKRLAEVLAGHEVGCRLLPNGLERAPEPGLVSMVTGNWGRGFELPGAGLVLVTELDLTGGSSGGSTRDMRRMPARRRAQVDPLALRAGDFVVHEQHGVGRFVEMTQRTVHGATREYLVLEYGSSKPRSGGQPDRLYVPTDQLDLVTKYVGGDSPTLHKLGGSDWAKTKSRARRHVRQIAGELIRLYSARQATKGHAFAPDTPWQRELEDAFAFVETPDQLVSIDEVKEDMEKEVPMDRLICGDVGYGKTEIAVRAAFKAMQDGKQVAILCPTTLLVQQHQNTFTERYGQFPVKVRSLSRFQSERESKAVLSGLADGSVDLVIGTHRLLGAAVRFKDLGLVVIDEEQRFGVEHKEQLKAMRTAVDVLAMSATPIPRTLEMAVTGIREMSTLATPPEERHPVLTYVGAYDERQVTAAVRRELLRDGQVFFVHNAVSSIERVAARLRELVPEARIVTAHGQMPESRLEQVVVDFWEKRSDVLVCTTIIETGLDISNTNTLIADRADVLGLAQLHQLRGRVGRGRERAYAYFFYPTHRPLTETAHDRLATIAGHTDLGAGMAVAMKDLEIRGAGNLLGGEQSGHIEGVGFDLYVRMVGEAVADFKESVSGVDPSRRVTLPAEVKIELPVDAHLPHDYIPGERLRLEAYTKLAAASDEHQISEIVEELCDRYGAPPEPVSVLVEVARLRTVARMAGVGEILLQGKVVRFAPVELTDSRQLRLQRLYRGSLIKPTIRAVLVPAPMSAPVGGKLLRDREVLTWAVGFLRTVLLEAPGA